MDEVTDRVFDAIIELTAARHIEKYKAVRADLGDIRAFKGIVADIGEQLLMAEKLPDQLAPQALQALIMTFVTTTRIIDAVFPETAENYNPERDDFENETDTPEDYIEGEVAV